VASLRRPAYQRVEGMSRTAIRGKVPIAAADGMRQFEGAELGARLGQLRTRWIACD